MLLDGWGNPILLVPPSGLMVNIKDEANSKSGNTVYNAYVVRTSGTYPYSATGSGLPPLTAADRPFFASAGADGDFSLGEDNVYSFSQD